jgi:type IV secretory pathway TrbL component
MNPGILTSILLPFLDVFTGAFGRLFTEAWTLFLLLAVLEVVCVGIVCALARDIDVIAELIWTVLRLGFCVFLGHCQVVGDDIVARQQQALSGRDCHRPNA